MKNALVFRAIASAVWAVFVCFGALLGEPLNRLSFKTPDARKIERVKMCNELVRWDYIVPSVPLFCWLTEPVAKAKAAQVRGEK